MDIAELRRRVGDSTIAAYLTTLLGVLPGGFSLALGLMVAHGLTEGVGVLLLVPLLSMVGLDVEAGSIGRLSSLTSSVFGAVGLRPTLVSVLGVFTCVMTVQAFLLRQRTIVSRALEHRFVAHLRQRLYLALANSSWLFVTRSRSSDFVHVLTAEVERVGMATFFLMNAAATAAIAAAYLLLALRLSAVATLLVAGSAGVLLLALRGSVVAARRRGKRLSRFGGRLYGIVIEHLAGLKEVKSYGAEARNVEIFAGLTDEVAEQHVDVVRGYSTLKSWFDVGSAVILSLTVFWSFAVLEVPTAGVLLLIFVFARIMPRVSSLQQSAHDFFNTLPAFTSVQDMLRRCEAATERPADRVPTVEFTREVRFDGVAFGYEEAGERPVVSGLDLVFRVGETTAIVGPSGAGKSTIADLLMGLLAPDRGAIFVDGSHLAAGTMGAWRAQIGYVAQETFLFHDSVRANLRWACPDADDAQIAEALRLAAADRFVADLPHGLDTVLGDRGVRLSGGERQRLALARALLRRPALLILDEATSNLDVGNERRILDAIEGLHGRMTIVTITHRLSAVRGADAIYVVEDGQVVETGSWERLLARGEGRFRSLCEAQGIQTPVP